MEYQNAYKLSLLQKIKIINGYYQLQDTPKHEQKSWIEKEQLKKETVVLKVKRKRSVKIELFPMKHLTKYET